MSLPINDVSPRRTYTATAAQTAFDVPFEFFDNTDLKVYRNGELLALATTPADITEYSASGAGVEGGGSITLGAGATAGDEIVVLRQVPRERVTDFPLSGPFQIAALNRDLARVTAWVQEVEDKLGRGLRLSESDAGTIGDLPALAERSGKYLGFSAIDGRIVTVDGSDSVLRPDLASSDADKGAAMVKLANGRTVAEVIASADVTLYVNASTGSDSSGNGTSGNPFATIQKAVDSLATLTGTYSAVIEVAAGTYATSSRAAASMDRPAVVYVDGLKIGKRTAQSGSTLSGGLVFKLAAGAKITPNATYPRGLYVTGHAGSVGIVGGEIEAAAGAESLIVAHRGAYVHGRNVTLDGNSIASLGIVSEAGGKAEMIDCSATGSTTDVNTYAGGFIQFASPAGVTTIGSITNNGSVSLGANIVVTGTVLHQGERFEFVAPSAGTAPEFQGNVLAFGGNIVGAWVKFSNPSAALFFHSCMIRGDLWAFEPQMRLFNTDARGNAWTSYITGPNSTHAEPMVLHGSSQFSGRYNPDTGLWGASTIRNSAGVLTGPVYAQNVQTFAAGGTVKLYWSGSQHTFVRVENTSGGTISPMTLAATLETNSMGGGNQPPDGSLWTFYTTSAQSMVFTPGTTIVALPLSSLTLGTAAAASRSITFQWSRALGKFQLISFSLNVQTAPINTYVAPSGGATIDAEARASLAQLAADVANLKSKTQAARIHG